MDDIQTVIKKRDKMKIHEYFKASWIFEKWYEKIILMIIGYLGLYKIYQLLFY